MVDDQFQKKNSNINNLLILLERKKNYIPIQCGFRKGHRSVQAVIEITNTLGKAIDNNLYTCGAFLGLVYTLNLIQTNLIQIKFVDQSTISRRAF